MQRRLLQAGIRPWEMGELTWPQLVNLLDAEAPVRGADNWSIRKARALAARERKRESGQAR